MTTTTRRNTSLVLLSAFLVAGLCLSTQARAAEVGDWDGYRGAISGTTAILGQRFNGPGDFGDAVVFKQTDSSSNTWTEQTSLADLLYTGLGGIQVGAEFGAGALALQGNHALVGAPRNNETFLGEEPPIAQAGRAFIFAFDPGNNTWSRQAALKEPTITANSRFGVGGDLDGNHALVLASGTNSAYMFTRTGSAWDSGVALAGGNIASPLSASVSGSLAAVGTFAGSGLVDVWQDNGSWQHLAQITNPGTNNLFATSIDLSGDTLVVSARQQTVGFGEFAKAGAGAVYVYRFDGSQWGLEQTIHNPDPEVGDSFGYSVAIDGDRLLVGTPGDDDLGVDSGSAYLFKRTGTHWSQSGGKILASGGAAGQWFGYTVDVEGQSILVAGPGPTTSPQGDGVSYFFASDVVQSWPVGDANHDGAVNDADAAILAQNWLQHVSNGDSGGDFNLDGVVDDRDAAIFAAHWQRNTEASGVVPEPGAASLLLSLALAGVLCRLARSRG